MGRRGSTGTSQVPWGCLTPMQPALCCLCASFLRGRCAQKPPRAAARYRDTGKPSQEDSKSGLSQGSRKVLSQNINSQLGLQLAALHRALLGALQGWGPKSGSRQLGSQAPGST